MSKFRILQLFSGHRAGPFSLTRTYIAATAGVLVFGGTATVVATQSKPAAAINVDGESRTSQPSSKPLIPQESQSVASDSSAHSAEDTQNTSRSVHVESNDTGTTVNVDGQTSSVPENGSMDQTYHSESSDGTSSSNVHVSIDNSSQSTAGSSRNSRISVRSQTRVEGRSSSNTTTQSSN